MGNAGGSPLTHGGCPRLDVEHELMSSDMHFFLKVSLCFERKGRSMDDILILVEILVMIRRR